MVMTSNTAPRSRATLSPTAASALCTTSVTEAVAKKIHERRCCGWLAPRMTSTVNAKMATANARSIAAASACTSLTAPRMLDDGDACLVAKRYRAAEWPRTDAGPTLNGWSSGRLVSVPRRGGEPVNGRAGWVARWWTAVAVLVLVFASVPMDASAKTKPARTTIDPVLLQDAL